MVQKIYVVSLLIQRLLKYLINLFQSKFLYIFWTVALILICLKVLFIPISSHPFDFAAYVFQIRQIFDLGTDPFFYWNKGVFLWSLFLGSYVAFDLLANISLFGNFPTELYHFTFKIPFLVLDVLTAYLISKTLLLITKDKTLAYLGCLLWLSNPAIFWITEVHGQYAVLVSFMISLYVYLMIQGKYLISSIPLAIATSVYYFPVILFPLLLLKINSLHQDLRSSLKSIILCCAVFFVTLLILFAPFLDTTRGTWLVSSLLHHSQPDAATISSEIKIPTFSLLNFPYFLISGNEPSNFESPTYFEIFSKSSLISIGLVILIYVFLLSRRLNKRPFTLDSNWILGSTLLVLSAFMAFLGKFQGHYVLWILPSLIIYILSFKKRLWIPYIALSLIPPIIALSTQNLGIFFLDSLEWGKVNFILQTPALIISALGFSLILSLIYINVGFLFQSSNRFQSFRKSKTQSWLIILIMFVVVVSFSIPTLAVAYLNLFKEAPHQELASENRVLIFSLPVGLQNISTLSDQSKIISDIKFNNSYENYPDYRGKFHPTNGEEEIYFYNVNNTKNILSSLGSGSLNIDLLGGNSRSEISYGSSGSPYLLSLEEGAQYQIFYTLIKDTENINSYVYPSARFGDSNRNIIAPSLEEAYFFAQENGETTYALDVRSKDSEYKYFEPYIKVESSKDLNVPNQIKILEIQVLKKDKTERLTYSISNPENIQTIRPNILDNNKAVSLYSVSVFFKSEEVSELISQVRLNNCSAYSDPDLDSQEWLFPMTCFNFDSDNFLQIDVSNTEPKYLKFDVSLVHDLIPRKPLFFSE